MEDSGSDYGSVLSAAQHSPELPYSYSKSTNTTFGQQTAWRSKPGTLSKQNFGSTVKFDDDSATPLPESDKGSSFGGS